MPRASDNNVTDKKSSIDLHKLKSLKQWLLSAPRWVYWAAGVVGVGGAVVAIEDQWSPIANTFFPPLAQGRIFTTERPTGIGAPSEGQDGVRRGYDRMEKIDYRLTKIAGMARPETTGRTWKDRNVLGLRLYPIYESKIQAGLKITDEQGEKIWESPFPEKAYKNFETLPKSLVEMLLYVENRALLGDHPKTWNHTVEVPRMIVAIAYNVGNIFTSPFGFKFDRAGGSTLAIQLEKILYTLNSRTTTWGDKGRQIFTAATRRYMEIDNPAISIRKTILNYINVAPMAAHKKFGEVIGFSEAFEDHFGIDIDEANRILNIPQNELHGDDLVAAGKVYRAALSLIMALQRPDDYLNKRPEVMHARVNAFLKNGDGRQLLVESGIITPELADVILATPTILADPASQKIDYRPRDKVIDTLRTDLMQVLDEKNLQTLDLLDMEVTTTVLGKANRNISKRVASFKTPEGAKAEEFIGKYLLDNPEQAKHINITANIYRADPGYNALVVEVDTNAGRFNYNGGLRNLGSTFKIPTTGEYFELYEGMFHKYKDMAPEDLRKIAIYPGDNMTRRMIDYMANPANARTIEAVLDYACDAPYSGNPSRTYFTNGGQARYQNFKREYDGMPWTVCSALRLSPNLPFVNMMEDMTKNILAQKMNIDPAMLTDKNNPTRLKYLEKYGLYDGELLVKQQFWPQQRQKTPDDLVSFLAEKSRMQKGYLSDRGAAVIYMTLYPDAPQDKMASFIREVCKKCGSKDNFEGLYNTFAKDKYVGGISTLADRGYIVDLNPIELMLARLRIQNPDIQRSEAVVALKPVIIESNQWLRTIGLEAGNTKMKIILEKEGFDYFYNSLAKKGYPFVNERIPSLNAPLGGAPTNPNFLANYMGILVRGGMQAEIVRYSNIRFGKDTPFDMGDYKPLNVPAPRRVMSEAVAKKLHQSIVDIVEKGGTAAKVNGILKTSDGKPIQVAMKTGSADGFLKVKGQAKPSESIGRSGTVVFSMAGRYFGTIVVSMPGGEEALKSRFNAAMAVRTWLKTMGYLQEEFDRNAGVVAPKISSVVKNPDYKPAPAIPPLPENKSIVDISRTWPQYERIEWLGEVRAP